MANLLSNKVCVVTGAGRGIGKAIASLFASEGAFVYVNDINKDITDQWISESLFRENLESLCFDITSQSCINKNLLHIKRQQKKIDVLVNNAGIEYNEMLGMISTENMQKMFNVNVFGTVMMLQATSRLMKRQSHGGSIINISSLVGLHGNPGQLVYSATKGAVIALTKSAAKELAPYKVRVNSIAPGLTQTEMMKAADYDKLQGRINNIAMGRLAQPEDIANGCLLLASDYSDYISGQILSVDGCTVM